MSDRAHEKLAKLAEWYATIHPRRIDIVGDFGGKQLFFVDGDSLLLHCVTASAVDFDIMILHNVIITDTLLAERPLETAGLIQNYFTTEYIDAFLECFCQEITVVIESDLGNKLALGLCWDIFDMIDGRIFLSLYAILSKGASISAILHDKARPLIKLVETWSGVSLPDCNSLQTSPNPEGEVLRAKPCKSSQATILLFNHEILNEFFTPVQLQATELQEGANEGKVFQELTHWHNAKRSLDPKRAQKRPGFFARKRNQIFMTDMLVYAASLTNATGKLIQPQIIAATPACPSKNTVPSRTNSSQSKTPSSARSKNKTRGSVGKDAAREASLSSSAQKLQKRNSAVFPHWHSVAQKLSQEPVLPKRFQKALKYFSDLSKEYKMAIGTEASLYLCDILYCAWEEEAARTSSKQALGVASLLFNQAMQTLILPGSTEEVAATLQILSSVVGIPSKESPGQQMISRQLSFDPQVYKTGNLTLSPLKTCEFQLGYCGPFLERTFDSQKDDRVPFEPDAWQRSVLDSIDANESLFIVAPTSSGKTFISFYAMDKILRGHDDGVLVYVAPTKALVNQIAAEIQARFRKTYNHAGRSVWAIHTRDYRVNNATGCQILVTVPHVLQIMLLSSSNVTGRNPWSKRVKRIIFDEVHCIGQADDGIIWEQLLLMAPCPIIALSATVGNTEEFYEWLKVSQTSKGFALKMITHNIRYSDLRAFHYAPPEGFEFKSLSRTYHFPVPGLDRPNRTSNRFRFIHPIAALAHRSGVDLENLSLEPRDALTLWESMKKFQNQNFPLDDSIDPSRVFSRVPKKSDVLGWAQKLKNVLATWIQDPTSPFDQVRYNLDTSHDLDNEGTQVNHKPWEGPYRPTLKNERSTVFALLCDLHKEDGLPAILFNYDRVECERTLEFVLEQLESGEQEWKKTDKDWQKDIGDYNLWKASKDKRKAPKKTTEKCSKEEKMREEANAEISQWEGFDPEKPLDAFSFADDSRLGQAELVEFIKSLDGENIRPYLFSALRRGIAVHHAGMNRRYRQIVEILFRKGYLTAVIATGTLALGINMPCKTVAFVGDSTFLTTLNYRQGAGRAGRRGFDLLGNVVFCNISRMRAYELMSSRLPDLKGHFPLTTTLVLRILGLADATGQSDFVSGIIKSLLTQSRLYLGGEESGKSIQHHLRFSIEYLQRQHLLSANGKPMNFAGLVGHLYFTENAVFAFHSLLKDGYFHRLCSNVKQGDTETLRTLGLVMAHLFNRIHTRVPDAKSPGKPPTDSGLLILPRLPAEAENLLIRHNDETLEIFKTYASTYIDQYLDNVPDRHLPLTGIAVGGEKARTLHLPGDLPPTKLRSPFSALSGHTDDFKSIRELCANVRSGVFLEESAVPYIPIWPYDLAAPLNSYIYDFLKHGDYIALTRDNKIKQGDVWFLLRDFSLVLATIVASLTSFIQADVNFDDADMIDLDPDAAENPSEEIVAVESPKQIRNIVVRAKLAKKKVAESWDDEDEDEDDNIQFEEDNKAFKRVQTPTPAVGLPSWGNDGKGLVDVLRAFTFLKQDFDEKFHKAWA
ncbi:hypothetical protein NUW58_g2432 [Xylaria curta]|uniref:Uncharacterized protein n=1 Tax=Xylaria curta TaxID=42375 RepID=A0ACC1PGZ0_9PEZI|nr:hypothetical protein NUW58_g2432 [Xylaria curta]